MTPAKSSPAPLNMLIPCAAAAAAVFVLDFWLVPNSIAGGLHALPVLLASRVSRKAAAVVAGACALLACAAWGLAVGAGSLAALLVSLVVIAGAGVSAFWPASSGEMADVHRQLQDSWYEAQMRAATLEELARELDEARNRALEAARTKSEFLANMSHEIRTPMTAILGSSEVLLDLIDAEAAPPDVTELLASIRVNGEHLLNLLNDILSLSKIEAGKLPTEQVRCSPAQLAFETRRVLGTRARQKGLVFKVEFPTAVPEWTETDPTRVRQILLNLVGNAIKFTAEGEIGLRVGFDSSQEIPRLVYEVTDTGIGMSPEQLDRVFEAFQQAESSTSRRFGGTGLGLTISRRMAELLGGDVEVQSTLGKGSVFRLRIPHIGVAPLVENPSDTSATAAAARQRRQVELNGSVLVADDMPEGRRLLQFMLQRAGANVELAEDGQVAYERVMRARESGRPFDVVLMDIQMPGADGTSSMQMLRDAGYQGLIVAVTAQSMEGERERCLALGFDDYLAKPYRRDQVLELVAALLDRMRNKTPEQ